MSLPKQYKYNDIADFLRHGREIEFVYKERECAITNHTSRWWFHDGVEQVEVCEFENFELLVSKVAEYIIDDRTVQDIFDAAEYVKKNYKVDEKRVYLVGSVGQKICTQRSLSLL